MADSISQDIWQVDVNGTIYEAPFDELGEWIGVGSLHPMDKVRKGNLRWIEARRVPSLIPFFNAKEKGLPMPIVVSETVSTPVIAAADKSMTIDRSQPSAGIDLIETTSATQFPSESDPKRCVSHPEIESMFLCESCCKGFCKACTRSYGSSVRLCPLCGEMCVLRKDAESSMQLASVNAEMLDQGFGSGDFLASLAYPFRFKTSLFFGAVMFALFSLGRSASALGGMFMFVAALFCVMLSNMLTFGVLANTIDNFVQGKLNENFMPDFEDFSLWDDVIHPFFLSIGAYLSSFGPFAVTAIVGFYLVVNSLSSQADTFKSEMEKIPGTDVYAGRHLAEQSGDVKEVLNGIQKKQADRISAMTEMADNNSNTEVENTTDGSAVDEDARQQEELWAQATDARKKQLESVIGKTPETRDAEQAGMIRAFFGLAAPIVAVGFVTFLWGLLLFPASCAVAGYTRSFIATINPLIALDTIKRLGFTYVKILLMGLALSIGMILAGSVLTAIFSPFDLPGMGNIPAKFIGSIFGFYLSVTFSCVIGFALFKSSGKLQLLR